MTDYFLSAEGDDNQSGTDPGHAWRNPSKIRSVPFLPGDRILFRRGDHFRTGWNIGLDASQGGNEEAPITLDAYGDGPYPILEADEPKTFCTIELARPWLACAHLHVMGMHNGILVSNAPGCLVREVVCKGLPYHGLQLSRLYGPSPHVILQNIQAYECGGMGISCTTEAHLFVGYNTVHHCCLATDVPQGNLDMDYTAGIKVFGDYGATGVIVEHNKCYANGNPMQGPDMAQGHGLWIDTVGTRSLIAFGNECHDNRLSGLMVELSTRVDVENNRCWRNGKNNASLPNKAGIVVFRGAVDCHVKRNVCWENPYQTMVYGYAGEGEEGTSQITTGTIFEENTLLSLRNSGEEWYRCEPPCDPAKQIRVNEVQEWIGSY